MANIIDIATASDDFSILVAALSGAGLVDTVRDANDITVFAPTDAAFAGLAADLGYTGDPSDKVAVFNSIADSLSDLAPDGNPIPLLTDVLLYHVSPVAQTAAQVDAADRVETLLAGATFGSEGTELVDNEPDLDNPNIVGPDIEADNGIVQVIDKVLLPIDVPAPEPQPIMVEAEDLHLSGYRVEHDSDASDGALIRLTGKKGEASTTFEGPAGTYDLTLSYFDEIDGEARIDVRINGERVERIVLDEHLGGRTATAENATSVTIEGLELEAGDTIAFVGRKDAWEFARIDKFTLTPSQPPNIVDIATGSEDFNILVKALAAAGLVETVRDANDVTVFAPTDAAFADLAASLGYTGDPADEDAVFQAIADALSGLAPDGNPIPLLTDVLLYHVSPVAQTAAEVDAADQVETLLAGATFGSEGTELIDNDPDLDNPNIVGPDIEAANGIVQVIDKVLLPIDVPAPEPQPIMVEAEDLHLSGYRVEHDSDASDGALIRLTGKKGVASTTFEGPAGTYDLTLSYFDEIDGEARIDVRINGERVERIVLDEHLGGRTATAENATSVTIEGLELEAGDTIAFVGRKDAWEFARIDKFTLTPSQPPNIVDIATGSEDFNILVKALAAAGLVETVRGANDVTVFAPTDAAFADLAASLGYTGDPADEDAVFQAIADALSGLAPDGNPIPLLTDVLLYHVSPVAQTAAEVDAADQVETLLAGATFGSEGTELVDNEPDLDNPNIVGPDIEAANGIVQVIDKVLLPIDIPGNSPLPNIVDIATGSEDFNILVKALAAAGLVETVRDANDVTVFAPTDAAFADLAASLGYAGDPADEDAVFQAIADALSGLAPDGNPIPLLTDVLLYHVSPIAQTAAEVDAADQVETLLAGVTFGSEGTELVDNEPDLDNPNIVGPDIEAANGIVQVIDKVLLPIDIPGNSPLPNIVDIATGSEDFNILVKALAAAGLVETVRDANDVTVFAPTDAAFADLAASLGYTGDPADEDAVFQAIADALSGLAPDGNPIPLLTDVLLYHVSPVAQTAAEVDAADQVETLLAGATFGSEGTELVDNEPDLDNPNIVGPDIEAANGIVQVIDKVLLPIDVPGNEAGPAVATDTVGDGESLAFLVDDLDAEFTSLHDGASDGPEDGVNRELEGGQSEALALRVDDLLDSEADRAQDQGDEGSIDLSSLAKELGSNPGDQPAANSEPSTDAVSSRLEFPVETDPTAILNDLAEVQVLVS